MTKIILPLALLAALGAVKFGCGRIGPVEQDFRVDHLGRDTARKVYAEIRAAEKKTGYALTYTDQREGMPPTSEIRDPDRRAMKQALLEIMRQNSLGNGDVFTIYDVGQKSKW